MWAEATITVGVQEHDRLADWFADLAEGSSCATGWAQEV
jgi:hypothetical protein